MINPLIQTTSTSRYCHPLHNITVIKSLLIRTLGVLFRPGDTNAKLPLENRKPHCSFSHALVHCSEMT